MLHPFSQRAALPASPCSDNRENRDELLLRCTDTALDADFVVTRGGPRLMKAERRPASVSRN